MRAPQAAARHLAGSSDTCAPLQSIDGPTPSCGNGRAADVAAFCRSRTVLSGSCWSQRDQLLVPAGSAAGPSGVGCWSQRGQLLVPVGSAAGPSGVSCWSQRGQLLVPAGSVAGASGVSCWSQRGRLLVPAGSAAGPSGVDCWSQRGQLLVPVGSAVDSAVGPSMVSCGTL